MIKKMISTGILIMLLVVSGCTVLAKDNAAGSRNAGQMEVIYIPDKKPLMLQMDKGQGKLKAAAKTGDSTVLDGLKILIIASAILLMLIIYIKRKGEIDYEEN